MKDAMDTEYAAVIGEGEFVQITLELERGFGHLALRQAVMQEGTDIGTSL